MGLTAFNAMRRKKRAAKEAAEQKQAEPIKQGQPVKGPAVTEGEAAPVKGQSSKGKNNKQEAAEQPEQPAV